MKRHTKFCYSCEEEFTVVTDSDVNYCPMCGAELDSDEIIEDEDGGKAKKISLQEKSVG